MKKLSNAAIGSTNWGNQLESCLAISAEVDHMYGLSSINFTVRGTRARCASRGTLNMDNNASSGLMKTAKMLKMTHMSINRKVDKLCYNHTMEHSLAIKRKEKITSTLSHIILRERSQTQNNIIRQN